MNLITKSNGLIEAKYKLTLEEQRIILYVVSLIESTDEDFKEYEVSIKAFSELANLKAGNQYKEFKRICTSLISKTLVIKESDNSITVTSWLSSANYNNGTGIIKLSFSPKLKPYLLQLKKNFTSYSLTNVLYLKSIYSIRIFELLKQYEKLSYRIFELEDLKKILCVENVKSYNKYADFKRFVILAAQNELKEKCDIYFDFEEIKEVRRVAKIKFLIFKNKLIKNNKEDTNTYQPKQEEIQPNNIESSGILKELKKIISIEISEKDLLSIWEASGENIELIKNRYEIAQNKKEIENFTGFMVWACKQTDEQLVTAKVKKKNKFVNFKQRDWDYKKIEELERKYLLDSLQNKSL